MTEDPIIQKMRERHKKELKEILHRHRLTDTEILLLFLFGGLAAVGFLLLWFLPWS